jgi:hypothetical protein
VARRDERISDDAGELAGDEDVHAARPSTRSK